MKIFNNKLLILCSALFIAQSLNAKMTMCYKKEWSSPSTVTKIKMDGGECKSQYSINEMKKQGWYVQDIKIESSKKGMNYTYILTDIKEKVMPSYSYKNKNKIITIPSFKIKYLKLSDVSDTNASINIGNLKIGQSGIVTHNYKNGKSLIVSNATVIESNENSSKLQLAKFDDLHQSALPTSNRKAQNGDTFILNYLYNASILIAPNIESFKKVRNVFIKHNFLHSDILATYLKYIREAVPTKEILQNFTKSQNIGTIFIALEGKVYIVDAKSFTVIDSYSLSFNYINQQMPFYTRIDSLDTYVWDIDFNVDFLTDIYDTVKEHILDEEELIEIEKEKRKEELDMTLYSNYYKKLLGL